MASPANLFALASGRLTPLSRTALTVGLGSLLAIVLLFEPVHQAAPRAVAVPAHTRLLENGSPWAERAQLLEGGTLFMPGKAEVAPPADTAQPDASPFAAFGPELIHDPAKPLALPAKGEVTPWKDLDAAFPWNEGYPLATLGQKSPPDTRLASRVMRLQVFSDKNEIIYSRDFQSGDVLIKNYKRLEYSDLNKISPCEIRLGIDTFGLQSNPYLLRTSGEAGRDQAVLDWSREMPWARWLPPGSYRVVIGP